MVGPGTGGTAARTPPGSPTKDGQRACKFFQTDQGCRRGAGCKYTHEFSSKDEKRSRCWFCGSQQHRQPECPVKDPAKAKRNGGGTTAPSPSIVQISEDLPRSARHDWVACYFCNMHSTFLQLRGRDLQDLPVSLFCRVEGILAIRIGSCRLAAKPPAFNNARDVYASFHLCCNERPHERVRGVALKFHFRNIILFTH